MLQHCICCRETSRRATVYRRGVVHARATNAKAFDSEMFSFTQTTLKRCTPNYQIKNAHTGNPGDGKIFVINVEELVKIRTDQRHRGDHVVAARIKHLCVQEK